MNVTLKSEVLTVSLNPERGNVITELILGGVNHIYLDQENLKSGQRPRCGCPVLFPYVGMPENGELVIHDKRYPAGIHGVVHSLPWQVKAQDERTAVFECSDTPETNQTFPFSFRLQSRLSADAGSLVYHTQITNQSKEVMPCDLGFHPFFRISDLRALTFEVDGETCSFTEEQFRRITGSGVLLRDCSVSCWQAGEFSYRLENLIGFRNLFLWSGKPDTFLVVEPWTGEQNAINRNIQMLNLPSGESVETEWKITVTQKL